MAQMQLILFEENNFDIVFLDENMPGLSGLETFIRNKRKKIICSNCYDYKK